MFSIYLSIYQYTKGENFDHLPVEPVICNIYLTLVRIVHGIAYRAPCRISVHISQSSVHQSSVYGVGGQGTLKILTGGPVWYRPAWYRTGPPPYPTIVDVTYKRNIVLQALMPQIILCNRPIASVQMTSITGSTLTSYPPFSLPSLACLS